MKIILTAESSLSAITLKREIISAVKGEVDSCVIDTWSYKKSGDNFDVIFHNPSQYVDSPDKNVVFRVVVEGTEVILSSAWWSSNPQPTREMICLHIGRLTEMLLIYFSASFVKYNVIDF